MWRRHSCLRVAEGDPLIQWRRAVGAASHARRKPRVSCLRIAFALPKAAKAGGLRYKRRSRRAQTRVSAPHGTRITPPE